MVLIIGILFWPVITTRHESADAEGKLRSTAPDGLA
jgi:hypothetical protein